VEKVGREGIAKGNRIRRRGGGRGGCRIGKGGGGCRERSRDECNHEKGVAVGGVAVGEV